MPEDLSSLKGDLSMLRDFLFFWIFLPILILILITKLLVQILFFTGIFIVAGGCHEFCVLRDNSRPRRALPTRQHAKQDPTQTYS